MQREQLCKKCKTYFFYDVEDDLALFAGKAEKVVKKIKKRPLCPRCDDPGFIVSDSYKKTYILFLFRKKLKVDGIAEEVLDDDTVISMLSQYPRALNLFNSNGTYTTFTLFIGSTFPGKTTEFKLGVSSLRQPKHDNPTGVIQKRWWRRELTCIKCGKKTIYSRQTVLEFYVGFKIKCCQKCDSYFLHMNQRLPDEHKRANLLNLNRKGSKEQPHSERAMARALNVTRMKFRRTDGIIERHNPLPVGTQVKSYVILEAYYDNKKYVPMYVIECTECKQKFRTRQSEVKKSEHFCPAIGRIR